MGRLAGIFHFDSAPVSREDRAQARLGLSDSCGQPAEHEAPGLLMLSSGQLAQSISGQVCAWDGRLDNPEELTATAGSLRSAAASALALALYDRRGGAGLGQLIGDWSTVIWDAHTRVMVLASDYAGVRPLYYLRTGDRLLWSSSLSHLARWSAAARLDDEYVAAFLTHGLVESKTPYRGIYCATPGACVRVTKDCSSTEPFWDFPAGNTRRAHQEDYADELRTRLQEAVAVRMRTEAPVAAELSGGLDSSSVVCVANRLIGGGTVRAPELRTFSYFHEGSTDEPYYRLVEAVCGLHGTHLDVQKFPFIAMDQPGVATPLFWSPRLTELSRQLASTGCHTFLTGQFGDFVMGNFLDDAEQVADLLQNGRFSAGLRGALQWSLSLRVPVYSILWNAARAAFFQADFEGNLDLCSSLPEQRKHGDSLSAAFQKRLAGGEKNRDFKEFRFLSPTRRKRCLMMRRLLAARVLQCPELLLDVDYTHPFAHRPLLEFMMTVPPEIVCGPGANRRLMRRALAGIVPDVVLKRRSKAAYNRVFRRALSPIAREILDGCEAIQLVERGYLDAASFRERLRRFLHGLDCNEHQLRFAILLEVWLRHRERAPRHVQAAAEKCVPCAN